MNRASEKYRTLLRATNTHNERDRGEEQEKGAEKICEEIMAEIFSKLIKKQKSAYPKSSKPPTINAKNKCKEIYFIVKC